MMIEMGVYKLKSGDLEIELAPHAYQKKQIEAEKEKLPPVRAEEGDEISKFKRSLKYDGRYD